MGGSNIYIYINTCVCIYIYIYMCACIYICIYIYKYICIHIYTYIYICIPTPDVQSSRVMFVSLLFVSLLFVSLLGRGPKSRYTHTHTKTARSLGQQDCDPWQRHHCSTQYDLLFLHLGKARRLAFLRINFTLPIDTIYFYTIYCILKD